MVVKCVETETSPANEIEKEIGMVCQGAVVTHGRLGESEGTHLLCE